MRHLFRNTVLILAIVLVAAASIWPPSKQLRRGKDLAGGTSLVYQVNVGPNDPPDTMENVRSLLKNRLDPSGLMEIQIDTLGGNRLEITMPLPGQDVKVAKAAYEKLLDELTTPTVTPEQFETVLGLPAEERSVRLAAMAGADAARLERLKAAAAAFDAAAEATRAFAAADPGLKAAVEEAEGLRGEAVRAGAPGEEIARLTREVSQRMAARNLAAAKPAEAGAAYEAARTAALANTLGKAEVRRAVELPSRPRPYTDSKTGQERKIPSPRERAFDRLVSRQSGEAEKKAVRDVLTRVAAGYDVFRRSRTTLDDAEDLKRLMRSSGVLTFRIAPKPGEVGDEDRLVAELREKGPKNVKSTDVKWFRLNKIDGWIQSIEELDALLSQPRAFFAMKGYVVDEHDGQYYMLCYDTPWRGTFRKRLTQAEGAWRLTGASQSPDEFGRPAVAFMMDTLGGDKLGQLTAENVNNAMAVLLDDEVYTAPNIRSQINASGSISGEFSNEEINYIIRVLNAGSLGAKIAPEPISDNTIGPELGADNLRRGLLAGVVSFVLVAGCVVMYYFAGGVLSVIALSMNALLILACMSLANAAFSLPGIAGVILTFGMAVDANVLIFERMREELSGGADLRTSVRLGYERALSAIIDGNMTNLIVCVVLIFMGTQEIRGFAITMTIGTLTTLFCQLFVTRNMFGFLTEKLRWNRLSMLPMAVPAIQRAFALNVDWMKYRWHFASVSIVLSALSIGALVYRGSETLDNEFLGGTKVTVALVKDGVKSAMKRAEVEERLEKFIDARLKEAEELSRTAATLETPEKREAARALAERSRQFLGMRGAEIITVNPQADGVTAESFVIKTVVENPDLVKEAVSEVFEDRIDTYRSLRFTDSGIAPAGPVDPRLRQVPVVPIAEERLSAVLPGYTGAVTVREFVGGAAVVVADIAREEGARPFPTLDSIRRRIEQAQRRADHVVTIAWQTRLIVLRGTPEAVESVALLVHDDQVSFLRDEGQWLTEVKYPAWRLVTDAMGTSSTSASVESFSAQIAQTFLLQAIGAVLLSAFLVVIYIFVRFNSLRYSIAAIATTLHDCLVAVGFIALAGVVTKYIPAAAAVLGLLPFKIDLNVIAAVLTILGYSLNDTVVVMDRIREIKGKLPYASRRIINDSINQTLSRTIITGGTTFIATIVLYVMGGEAVRAFSFCFIVGILVGTYSSIAVAAPIVWVRKSDPTAEKPAPAPALPA
jgi:SecD/SecF fusion protein